MSGSEARRPAPATNSTRVASATDLAKIRPASKQERGRRVKTDPERVYVYAERVEAFSGGPLLAASPDAPNRSHAGKQSHSKPPKSKLKARRHKQKIVGR